MKSLFFAATLSLSLFGLPSNATLTGTIEVPLRADLGIEQCRADQSNCSRTPFSGENIVLKIDMIKDNPETWEGTWRGEVESDRLTFESQITLRIEATPGGYSFQLISRVEDSETVMWLENLSKLPHTEIRGRRITTPDGTVQPYLYLSAPLP
ncbi:MAG: hypothetical protein AB7F86_11165 [Bdellovibrionales bacterium]